MDKYHLLERLKEERRRVIDLARDIDYKNGVLMKTEIELEEKDELLKAAVEEKQIANLHNIKLKHEIESFECQRAEHEKNIAALEKSLEEMQITNMQNTKLKNEMESFECKRAEYQKRITTLEKSMEEMQITNMQNMKLKHEIVQFECQITTLENSLKEMQITNLQNVKMKNEIASFECRREEYEKRITTLEKLIGAGSVDTLSCIEEDRQQMSEMQIERIDVEHSVEDGKENDHEHQLNRTHSMIEMEKLRRELEELKNENEGLKAENQVLMIKERMSNDELQEARKEATKVLPGILNNHTKFKIRRMGELDPQPFKDMCGSRASQEECARICSMWEENLMNPHWHPFKRIKICGSLREIIDENDEKLKDLRHEGGERVYKAVEKALLELNQYNPSGRYPVPEIWNSKEERKASLNEIICYLTKQLKDLKRKNK